VKTRTNSRWIKCLACGFAIAAFVASAAHGAYEPLYQHRFLSDGTPVHPLFPTSQLEQFRFTLGEKAHPFSFTRVASR